MRNHFTIPHLKFKSGASSIWNGILKALPLLTNGMRRLIGDGNDVLFWLDCGLMNDLLVHIFCMSSTLLTCISSWQTIGLMGLVEIGLLFKHFFPPTIL